MTDYINVDEIDKNQREVMLFVDFWVREKKTPVPQKEIVAIISRVTTINILAAFLGIK